jgi:hypothetical protein
MPELNFQQVIFSKLNLEGDLRISCMRDNCDYYRCTKYNSNINTWEIRGEYYNIVQPEVSRLLFEQGYRQILKSEDHDPFPDIHWHFRVAFPDWERFRRWLESVYMKALDRVNWAQKHFPGKMNTGLTLSVQEEIHTYEKIIQATKSDNMLSSTSALYWAIVQENLERTTEMKMIYDDLIQIIIEYRNKIKAIRDESLPEGSIPDE